jgi:hypothetical protein
MTNYLQGPNSLSPDQVIEIFKSAVESDWIAGDGTSEEAVWGHKNLCVFLWSTDSGFLELRYYHQPVALVVPTSGAVYPLDLNIVRIP